jgi:4-alpha-glucanotransferase
MKKFLRRSASAHLGSPLRGGSHDIRANRKWLHELADLHGVERSYDRADGKRQTVPDDGLRRLLGVLGVDARTERLARQSLREARLDRLRDALPPVMVAWDGKPIEVICHVPKGEADQRAQGRIVFENGSAKVVSVASESVRVERDDGLVFAPRKLRVPPLEPGYHHLEYEMGHRVYRMLVISAPSRAYSPPGETRRWGVFAPMYALNSAESWGPGDLADWRRLGQWVSSVGGEFVSTLPILAAFLGPVLEDPSPYSPASRLFWNEFYLEVPGLPEFAGSNKAQELVKSPSFQQVLAKLRQSSLVDYAAVMGAKRRVIEILAREAISRRRDYFSQVLEQRPELKEYAQFRAATEAAGRSWSEWGERQRQGKLQPSDFDRAAVDYHVFAQSAMQRQISELRRRPRIATYLDLPLGIHPDGYDMWRYKDAFVDRASTGAPPDPFFSKGQNWGFAPLHPERIRRQEYHYVRSYLAFQMRHCDYLRIDHVMGLHRLFWIPTGSPASEGAYVRYRADEFYALLSLESHRHKTVLAGEDLGTVPPEVRQAMQKHGLRRLYVLQFEQRPDPARAVSTPPRASVASLNTHDMATFAAQWEGRDIDQRLELGLISTKALPQERRRRERINSALVQFLRRRKLLARGQKNPAEVMKACLEWLASSAAEVLQINLEDLWLETEPQNVPGTSTEKPNWRRKTKLSLEQIEASVQLREFFKKISSLRIGGS